ncbi:hypothetical protein LGN43_10660 [Burkholderia multivorans]|nr:hypothetical protein [Burkholderia multivorans]
MFRVPFFFNSARLTPNTDAAISSALRTGGGSLGVVIQVMNALGGTGGVLGARFTLAMTLAIVAARRSAMRSPNGSIEKYATHSPNSALDTSC